MSDTAPGSLRGAAVRGLGWTLLRSVSSRLVGSLVFIVLARLLDPETFGAIALASVFVVLLSLLVESGFGEAVVQRKALTARELDTAFWANIAIGVGLATALAAGAGLIAAPFDQPDLAPVLRALSPVLVLAGLSSVPQALLRRELAFRQLALRGLAATVAGGVVGVGMALAGFGVWSLVGQLWANSVAGAVVLWLGCSWRPGRNVSRSTFVALFRFGANVLGERVALFTSRRSDDFLVGLVLGPVALGLYTAAYRILLLFTEIIIWTIESVAFPLFSRLQGDVERSRRAFYTVSQVCLAVAVPAFLTLAVLAPELTLLALGPKWTEAVPVMRVLALVGLPHAVVYVNKAMLTAAGRPNLSLRVALLTGAVNLLGFLLVVRWGVLAVAISFVVCGYLLAPVSVWSVTRVLPIELRTYLRLFVPPLASGLTMLLSMVALKMALDGALTGLALVAVLLPFAAGVYLLVLYLTDRRLIRGALTTGRRLVRSS